MDMKSYIFLIISSLSSAVSGAIQITTNPTNASLQRSVSVICLTDEPYVEIVRLPTNSLCMIIGTHANGSCELVGSCSSEYMYTCNIVNNYTVTIPGSFVTEQLHGTQWSCRNPFHSRTSVVTRLFVNIPISSVQIAATPVNNNPVEINNGTSQYFKCTTSSGRPSSRIQWYKSNINLTSDAIVQPDVCSLDCSDGNVISSSVLEYIGNSKDDGKYIYCSALNTYNMEVVRSQNISIIIWYGPQKVDISPSAPFYVVNETTDLDPILCVADCKPECKITWNGPTIPSSTYSVLFLQNITRNQTGEYYCKASNSFGSAISIKVYVSVNYAPYGVTLSPSTHAYIVNETGNLGPIICTADCLPKCNITWKGPNIPSDANSKLTLTNISRNQEGQYHCIAKNHLGEMVSLTVFVGVYYPCIRCNAAQNDNDEAIFKAGISSLVIGIFMILITIVANCFIHRFRKPKRKEDSRSNDYVQTRASNSVYTGVYDNAGQEVSNADSVTKTSAKGESTDTYMYEELQQNTKSKDKHTYQTLQEHGKGDDSRKSSQYVNMNF